MFERIDPLATSTPINERSRYIKSSKWFQFWRAHLFWFISAIFISVHLIYLLNSHAFCMPRILKTDTLCQCILPENRSLSVENILWWVFPEINGWRTTEFVLVSISMFDHEKSNCSNSLYFDLMPEFRLRCEKCARNYDEAFQRILFWQINYQ